MTTVLEVEDAVLGVAGAAMSLEDHQKRLGPIAHTDIPPGSFPFAYTFAFGRVEEAGETGQVTPGYSGTLVLVTEGRTYSELRADAETIYAALIADRSLGGLVLPETTVELAFADLVGKETGGAAVFAIDSAGSADSSGGELIQWTVTAQVDLRTPSVAEYLTALSAALVTTLSATRLESDLGDPTETITAGTTRYQLNRVAAPSIIDSNVTSETVTVELNVYRRLLTTDAERDYTEGDMVTQTLAVLAPDYFKAGLNGVNVIERGSLDFPGDIARL